MTTDTTLHGKWLTLARAAWVIIAVFYIGAFLVSVPLKLNETPSLTLEEGVTPAEFYSGLAQMGVSQDGYLAFGQWSGIVIGFVYLTLAVFIFWRKSDDWMALLTAALFLMFWGPFEALAALNPVWTTVGDVSAIVSTVLLFLWFFIFPDGHFVPRWMRWIFLVLLATQIWRIFQPAVYESSFIILIPVFFGSILLSQVFRYRHASAAQRQQIKWVVFGIVAGSIPLLVFVVVYLALLNSQPPVTRVIAVNFSADSCGYFSFSFCPSRSPSPFSARVCLTLTLSFARR